MITIKTCSLVGMLCFSTICFAQQTDTISIKNSTKPLYKTIIVDGKETREAIPQKKPAPIKVHPRHQTLS